MTAKRNRGRAGLLGRPSVNVAIFAFLLNYPWEFLQIPFYRDMPEARHWAGVLLCSIATLGDAAIMLFAYWLTSRLSRAREWALAPGRAELTMFIAIGLAITVLIERLALEADWGWRYAAGMPRVPLVGAGLAPTLQWLVLPPLTIWFVRRQVTGARQLAASVDAREIR